MALLAVSGCASDSVPTSGSTVVDLHLQGTVFGGQQPVTGATVQMYHVNTSTEKGASVSMLTGTGSVTTLSDGSFSITGKYTCGTATDVYLTATGGAALPGQTNSNSLMMVALGQCSTLATLTHVSINELTTVAAVTALAPFMTSPTAIGTGSSQGETNYLDARFTLAQELVSIATGSAPGTNLPSGMGSPATLINTLGGIMAACVNSTGGSATSATVNDGSLCGELFSYATPPGGSVPTDTATAMLNVANHPTLQTTQLFGLISTSPPFQPSASSAPSTFAVALVPSAFTVTRSVVTFPDAGFTSIYTLINNAASKIDMTMYELQDTTASGDLVAACNRGVKVRAILNSSTKSANTAAYNQINAAAANCTAVWSNTQFTNTHEKSLVVDGTQLALLTANLQSQYYTTTRDFAIMTNDPVDVAAVEDTFNQDYGSSTDEYYENLPGNDLLWSPTSAQTGLLQTINNATQTVTVENEEMSATNIITALSNAAARGVVCKVIMTNDGSYTSQLTTLKNAGCSVRVYADNSTTLYIHAKVVLADYGTSGALAYVGSINFSTASMLQNRELGTVLTDTNILSSLNTTLNSDYSGATAF